MATSFDTALKRGYSVLYALQVEGIPWLFVETSPKRATADAEPSDPTYYHSDYAGGVVAGLVIDGQKIAQELDRETGLARGRKVTFKLAQRPLSGAGILDDLFARPTLYSDLLADIDTGDTNFTAKAVGGGWAAGGVYIGSEFIHAAGVSHSEPTTTFASLTRGQWGDKYDHKKKGFTGSQWATNRPQFWRGRLVTLWECLVDREGRTVFDTWLSGDYCRQVWKGTLETNPLPTGTGFQLTAAALTRKLTKKMGFTGQWETHMVQATKATSTTGPNAGPDESKVYQRPALYDPGEAHVGFKLELSTGTVINEQVSGLSALTNNLGLYDFPAEYAQEIATAIVTAGSAYLENPMAWNTSKKEFVVAFDVKNAASAATKLKIESYGYTDTGSCPYFLTPGQIVPVQATFETASTATNAFKFELNYEWDQPDSHPWLVVHNFETENFQDYTLPTAGLMVAEDVNTGAIELLRFGDGRAIDDTQWGLYAIHILQRGINSTLVNLAKPIRLTLVTGAVDTLDDAVLTLLESSGTGTRGDKDTLGYGMGYNIDDGHIDLAGFAAMYFADRTVVAIDEGKTTFEDALGGWMALSGTCVALRRNSAGVVQLSPRQHEVYQFSTMDPAVKVITAADVLLRGLDPLEVVDAPNEVQISAKSYLMENAPDVLVRSIPEMIREGIHSWSMTAPEMSKGDAKAAAERLIALGAGQYALSLTLGPWVDIQAGDPCILQLNSHLGTFDFIAGTYGTTSLSARCVGVERDLMTLEQRCRFLLYGKTLPGSLYCPAVTITAHHDANKTLTLGTGEGSWFVANDKIRVYNPGKETLGTPELADMTVASVAGDVVTVTATPPAWIVDDTTRGTYPVYADATTAQRTFFFFDAAYRWN